MRIVNFIFLLFVLLASCQSPKEKAKREDKFSWNAGISAPKNYIATPFVEYFYQGKTIVATLSLCYQIKKPELLVLRSGFLFYRLSSFE